LKNQDNKNQDTRQKEPRGKTVRTKTVRIDKLNTHEWVLTLFVLVLDSIKALEENKTNQTESINKRNDAKRIIGLV